MSTAIFDTFPEREDIESAIATRIVGQETVIEDMLIALFSGGHCLFIGVPGLAKTLMVNTISDSLGLTFRRVQFTPDLMPSDITGSEILQQDPESGNRKLQFVRGPIFTNLLLADEINRTPPKTQSALLEAMQERQVTALGTTYELTPPFQVFATQNPIEQEGTYPLPEAALDRFMFSVFVEYPSAAEEMEIVRRTIRSSLPTVENVMSQAELLELQSLLTELPISDEVIRYCTALARATRPEVSSHENVKQLLRYGAGTRASTYLAVGARTLAAMNGHETPSVDDVRRVAPSVLRHRSCAQIFRLKPVA